MKFNELTESDRTISFADPSDAPGADNIEAAARERVKNQDVDASGYIDDFAADAGFEITANDPSFKWEGIASRYPRLLMVKKVQTESGNVVKFTVANDPHSGVRFYVHPKVNMDNPSNEYMKKKTGFKLYGGDVLGATFTHQLYYHDLADAKVQKRLMDAIDFVVSEAE